MINPFKRIAELDERINQLEIVLDGHRHWVVEQLKDIRETKRDKVKAGEAGPTMGSYYHVDEVNPPKPRSGKPKGKVVTPKTPQQIENETIRKVKEMNEPVRTVPNE